MKYTLKSEFEAKQSCKHKQAHAITQWISKIGQHNLSVDQKHGNEWLALLANHNTPARVPISKGPTENMPAAAA